MNRQQFRARACWFTDDPLHDPAGLHYLEDALLVVEQGRIAHLGPFTGATDYVDLRPHLVMPGLIDMHIHFPQTQVIASYGAQLLEWLNRYTFPSEARYADPAFCARMAQFFIAELFRNGTTTAVVFGSVHPQSAAAVLAEAEKANARMIVGKVMMNRNAPEAVLDTTERGYAETEALIKAWHGRGRCGVAITPRFALTSTPDQLDAAADLMRRYPDCWMQTHLSENLDEIAFARRLFPEASSYTDIYARHNLLGPRSLFGHCIHLDAAERKALAESGSVAVFCPTSNLFIGSGLFDWQKLSDDGVRIAVATDVGGGTSYSLLQTANEGYKVQQLKGRNWPGPEAFYAMTLGNARALGLAAEIGSLTQGQMADFVVLDSRATPAMAHRAERLNDIAEELFLLMTLGDDRAIAATYVAGECVWRRG